jgi:hypothetical protein
MKSDTLRMTTRPILRWLLLGLALFLIFRIGLVGTSGLQFANKSGLPGLIAQSYIVVVIALVFAIGALASSLRPGVFRDRAFPRVAILLWTVALPLNDAFFLWGPGGLSQASIVDCAMDLLASSVITLGIATAWLSAFRTS